MQNTVNDIIKKFEELIPTYLAEKWDNVGLQVGTLQRSCNGILTCLDVTADVIDYAIAQNLNLIVSHHPLIFNGIKKLDTKNYLGSIIEKAIKNDITIYSAHTNLDIANNGLNDFVAEKLGLLNIKGLVKTDYIEQNYKLVVFVPEEYAENVRQAIAAAGAGWIGNYSDCTFEMTGNGYFKPLEGANPFIGKISEVECVKEKRLETIVPANKLNKVLKAMSESHPYEEIAYDIYPLTKPHTNYYLGRVGELKEALDFNEFHKKLKNVFEASTTIRLAGKKKDKIRKIAICTGAGASFIDNAVKCEADAYITGDVKYHEAQKAKEKELLLIDAGHFGTEKFAIKILADIFKQIVDEEVTVVEYPRAEDFFF